MHVLKVAGPPYPFVTPVADLLPLLWVPLLYDKVFELWLDRTIEI
jgi:hypothetical protein